MAANEMEALLFAGLEGADAALIRAAPEERRAQLMAEYKVCLLRERHLLVLKDEAAKALFQLSQADDSVDGKARERAFDRLLEMETALTRVQGHLRGVVQDLGPEDGKPDAPRIVDTQQMDLMDALLDAPAPDRGLP